MFKTRACLLLACALPSLWGCSILLSPSDLLTQDGAVDTAVPGEDTLSDGADLAEADAADACTADLQRDPHNCGACGVDCCGGACNGGKCAMRRIAQGQSGLLPRLRVGMVKGSRRLIWATNGMANADRLEEFDGSEPRFSRPLASDTSAMATSETEVFIASVSGFSRAPWSDSSTAAAFIGGIGARSTWLEWDPLTSLVIFANPSERSVFRANPVDRARQSMLSSVDVTSMMLVEDTVYLLLTSRPGGLGSLPHETAEVSSATILVASDQPRGLTRHEQFLGFGDAVSSVVNVYDTKNLDAKKFSVRTQATTALTDGNRLYWASGDGRIYVQPYEPSGEEPQTLAEGQSSTSAMVLVNKCLYWLAGTDPGMTGSVNVLAVP